MTALSVVIVTFNSAHVIRPCLQALGDLTDSEIVVVDNQSSDRSVELIRKEFPAVVVIEAATNGGFAKGVNAGIAASTGERVMLLNPDAVVDATSVRFMIETVDRHWRSLVAPLIQQPGGATRIGSGGRFPTPWRMGAHYFGLSRLSGIDGHYLLLSDVVAAHGIIDVEWATGACVMASRSTVDAVGGLDERWFMYAEDIDLCWRVRRGGGTVLIDTRAHATHLVGESNARRGAVNSMWVVNLYDFYVLRMAPSRSAVLRWGLVVAAGLAVRSLVFALQGLNPRRRASRLIAAAEFRAHSVAVLRCVVPYTRRLRA